MDKVTCPICDQPHDLSDMQVGFDKPDAWFALPSDERDRRTKITPDYAEIDGVHHFVRGVLEIPVRGEQHPFVSQRPTFGVADQRHPLGVEQQAGIHVERALEHLSHYIHWSDAEPVGAPHTATMSADGWQLDDALARYRARDRVYWVPDRERRESISVGELAKLLFAIEASDESGAPEVHRERMWVEVDGVVGEGFERRYTGVLTNDPVTRGLTRRLMRVWFGPDHVIDIGRVDQPAASESRDVMRCSRHGVSDPTYMCEHLVRGTGLGFNRAYDPDSVRPDAWCDACDAVLKEVGEWNERSEAVANITVVCAACYDAAEARNSR